MVSRTKLNTKDLRCYLAGKDELKMELRYILINLSLSFLLLASISPLLLSVELSEFVRLSEIERCEDRIWSCGCMRVKIELRFSELRG